MTRLSFHDDPALKEHYLRRLRGRIAAGDFRFAPTWQDGKGSALGCTIDGSDPADYARALGYPDALAMVLDDLVNFRSADPDARAATDFAVQWLAQTPVGVDLSSVAGKVIVLMLAHPLVVTATRRDVSVDAARNAVMAMHRSVLGGGDASRPDWRRARRAAVEATDTTADDRVHAAAAIVEAAAWPHTLRTTLYDTLTALSALAHSEAQADIGWSVAEEKAVFATFDRIFQASGATEPPVGDDLLHRLASRDPVMAARFTEWRDASTKAQKVYAEIGDAILCEMMASPPAKPG